VHYPAQCEDSRLARPSTTGEVVRELAQSPIPVVRAILTDNHWSYAHSGDLRLVLAAAGTEHWFIKPHCPWQNGIVERFNRTLATEWAYRRPYLTNDQRTAAFTTWLEHYNTGRYHYAVGAAPITRLSPT
jgi:transposase InsO family protein